MTMDNDADPQAAQVPATEDAAASVPDDPESLKAALEQARGEASQYLDHLRRERADFTNFRRRVEEDKVKQTETGTLNLLMRLLPIVDDFERAVGSAQPQELESSWGKGVQLIERNFRSLLAAEGVERIEAQGAPFNPWEHEAVSYQPTAEGEDGTVMYVVRPGYRKGDRVIRPAQVVVGRASENAKN